MQNAPRTWLLIDGNFLCHRSFYPLKDLEFNEIKTGVLYGFFNDLRSLQERFNTRHLALCFDHGRINVRTSVFAGYKAKRKQKSEDPKELQAKEELHKQINALYRTGGYLERLGFKNIFYQKGHESDDVIASISKTLPEGDEAVIVTSDGDLFQLISNRVTYFNPASNKLHNVQSFVEEYNIAPQQWWKVKALAGCSTDEVPGIPGVGDKTAIRYLNGELPETHKTYQRITSSKGRKLARRNRKLVKLPFSTTSKFRLQDDKFDQGAWEEVCKELGFRSSRGTPKSRKGFLDV